ncbi:MAG: response regulator transcription factor [Lachnospiraceae bacterium]|nr:response regulator transcription factor [Lachnospiraceae bacterium]MBP3609764.1 response regulator transcription factor [Lachnospiraceae bacterium]
MKIAFCDDDVAVLNELSVLIDRYRVSHNRDIVYTAFHSPLELLAGIEKGARFDVLFLDVIMPGENGIETAKEIRKYDDTVKIIFLTSSAEFAVQSYAVGAYFYQLKPIWEESFFRLMESVVLECKKEKQCSLIVRCKTGIARIELDRLEYCEVLGRTVVFHLENGKVLERIGSLDELCSQLEQYDNFLRPHRSYLVNMEYIQTMSYKSILMDSLAEIPIPRGKYSEIKDKYLEYAFNKRQVLLS